MRQILIIHPPSLLRISEHKSGDASVVYSHPTLTEMRIKLLADLFSSLGKYLQINNNLWFLHTEHSLSDVFHKLCKTIKPHIADEELCEIFVVESAGTQAHITADIAGKMKSLSGDDFIVVFNTDSFEWPTTAVKPSHEALSEDQFTYQEGLLSFMGYRVGANGLDEENRRAVLDYVFNKEVPRVQSEEHMIEWDVPLSSARLKKWRTALQHFAEMHEGERARIWRMR